MTELFDRAYVLRVGDVEIRDLRVAFLVERTSRSTPNKAEITVSNLSAERRGELERLDSVSCTLAVGYGTTTHVIFSGDLSTVANTYEQPNWTTKISGVDGGRRRRTARIQRSFRPGTPLRAVFEAIASAMGLGVGNLPNASSSASLSGGAGSTLVGGTAIEGSAAEALEGLCRSCELEWSIQGGALQLVPLGQALRGAAIRLDADSGLVGDVSRETGGKIKLRALMIPDLFPGRLIEPRTRTLTAGQYRVTKATYRGDSHGQDWYVECEAEPPGTRTSARASRKPSETKDARR
jgi:hypothetical protein